MDYVQTTNLATASEIEQHFNNCDQKFLDNLTARTDIGSYIKKLLDKSTRYEIWDDMTLIGFLAIYHNTETRVDFISNISVIKTEQGKGWGKSLLAIAMRESATKGATQINLEVAKDNQAAQSFYKKHGFLIDPHNSTKDQSSDCLFYKLVNNEAS